jgi:DNA-binding response OmpR family regulator
MTTNVWVVPVGAASATLADVQAALEARRLAFTVLDRPWVRHQQAAGQSTVAVLTGGVLDTPVLDVLRSLNSMKVPTLALVEDLTDHQESLLLGAGAFDVVGLPASSARLGSRIGALYRNAGGRSGGAGPPVDEVITLPGSIKVWPARREVRVGDRDVALTKTEFDLLAALGRDPERVLTRHELAEPLTGRPLGPRALESHLSRLRLKVIEAGGPRLIESVRGVGYRLRTERARKWSPPAAAPPRTGSIPS